MSKENRKVNKTTKPDIQSLLGQKQTEGLSPTSIEKSPTSIEFSPGSVELQPNSAGLSPATLSGRNSKHCFNNMLKLIVLVLNQCSQRQKTEENEGSIQN